MIYKVRVRIKKSGPLCGMFDGGGFCIVQQYVEAETPNQARGLIEHQFGKNSCLSVPVPVDEIKFELD